MADTAVRGAVPEQALQAIQKLIREGGYQPGDALPSQRDLAERLGVSRASLREALSSLSALGLVSVQAGKGVYVQATPIANGAGAKAFSWPYAEQVSAVDTFQLRYVLEGFAAGRAASTLTALDIDELHDNVEAMRLELRAQHFEAAARLDFEFHRRLLQASGNLAIEHIISASETVFLESQKLPFIRPERAWKPGKNTAKFFVISRVTPMTRRAKRCRSTSAMQRRGPALFFRFEGVRGREAKGAGASKSDLG